MGGISVVICCYNSALNLPGTIKHLAQQKLDCLIKMEIIIVNNASTDNTVLVAQNEWAIYKNSSIDFKIISQQIPGKSFALEKGIEQAKYEYIIICDDDNWLEENYVINAYKLLNSNIQIGAAGGTGIAVSNTLFPEWWDIYKNGYAIGNQGNSSGDITDRKFVWGAGMVTRRSLFLNVFTPKYPALLTCRKGTNLSSGGDSEFSMRLILRGYKLYFDKSLSFKHFIPKERLTESYRDKLFQGFKDSQIILNEYMNQINYNLLSRGGKIKYFFISVIRLFICSIYKKSELEKQCHVDKIYRATQFSIGNVSKNVKMIADFAASYRKFTIL
jgi:glycosyltransferase involved in cell wall biosynthesis